MGVRDKALATVRGPREEVDNSPDYFAFAKVGRGWFKLGAAWKTRFRNDTEGYSLQFSTLPLAGWDGKFILALPNDDVPEEEQPRM